MLTIAGTDIFGAGDVLINGNQALDLSFDDSTSFSDCSFDINMATVLSNIALNVNNDECPSAGSIIHNGSMSISCTGDTTFSFNDNWTISQTFSGGNSTVVFENSTTRWEVTDSCGSGGSQGISPLGRISDFR